MRKILKILIVILASFFCLLFFSSKTKGEQIIFEDGFEAGMGPWQLQPGTSATITTEKAHTGSRSLKVSYNGGGYYQYAFYLFPTPQQGRISVWFYDDLSPSGAFFSITDFPPARGIAVGLRTDLFPNTYTYFPSEQATANPEGAMDTGIRRTAGWHQLKIFVTPKGTYGKIDGQSLSFLPANSINGAVYSSFTSFQRISLGGGWVGQPGNYFFDDVSVDTWPPPSSNEAVALKFINTYLNSYENIDIQNINNLIKRREKDFQPTNPNGPPHWHYEEQLFHVYHSLLLTAGAHSMRYLKEGRASDLEKAIKIIEYVNGEYDHWKQKKSGSMIGLNLALDSWFIWNHLNPSLQESIRTHFISEGEYFKNIFQPYSEYIGNSSGEENSWPALYLGNLSFIFAGYPEAQGWRERAKFFAFHSLTKNETYGNWTSRTIYDDFMFDNHDYHPHPSYGSGVSTHLAWLEFLSKKIIGSSPTEFRHNSLLVWKKMQEFIDFRSFQFKGNKIIRQGRDQDGDGVPDYTPSGNVFVPSGKDDWGNDASWFTHYRLMKEIYNYNSYTDPDTGYQVNDLAHHAAEYIYYIRDGYLWRPTDPNIHFTEMLIDHGFAHPFPGWMEIESYKWFRNAAAAWDFVIYLSLFDPSITLLPISPPSPTPTPPPSFSLSLGWNEISWLDVSGKKASDIPTECPTAVAKENFWFVPFVKNFGGVNFSFESGKIYFIKCNQAVDWHL